MAVEIDPSAALGMTVWVLGMTFGVGFFQPGGAGHPLSCLVVKSALRPSSLVLRTFSGGIAANGGIIARRGFYCGWFLMRFTCFFQTGLQDITGFCFTMKDTKSMKICDLMGVVIEHRKGRKRRKSYLTPPISLAPFISSSIWLS